jgi:hypothetical protein
MPTPTFLWGVGARPRRDTLATWGLRYGTSEGLLGWRVAMFHVFQLARSQRRQIIDRLEVAIRLVEDHVAWAEAYSARLAAAGRTEDATYARASLELGRLHLDLLCRGRRRLLLREWPREGGRAALEACLLNALRDWR